MFKWFWTIFSLGAPDNTGQTLLGEWEIYRPQFSDIPKIDNLNFGGITRENWEIERDWDFSRTRVILRSAIKTATGQNRFWEKKWLICCLSQLACACCVTLFPFHMPNMVLPEWRTVVQLVFRCSFPRPDVHFVIQADSQAKLNV